MNFGNWKVDISNKMPQTVATAMAGINEKLTGAEYESVVYLGSQTVNGVNHAVLARQTVLTGRDTENIVVLIFNEKPGDTIATLVNIERVLEGGLPMGGVRIDIRRQMSSDMKAVWDTAFEGFVGYKLEPIMLLGTQTVNGTNYTFLAKANPVIFDPEAEAEAALVTISDFAQAKSFAITDLLKSNYDKTLSTLIC